MSLFAQFVAQAAAPQPSPFMSFVPMLLILVVFYFLLIAPMRKRQKEHQSMVDALKKGDRVVTNGGLHGQVASVDGATVALKISDQVKVRVDKAAVARVADQGGS